MTHRPAGGIVSGRKDNIMEKFEVGKTYYCRSICDQNCVWNYTITKRTDKSVWIGGRRFNVGMGDNSERIFPLGKYSMCPVLRAENEVGK